MCGRGRRGAERGCLSGPLFVCMCMFEEGGGVLAGGACGAFLWTTALGKRIWGVCVQGGGVALNVCQAEKGSGCFPKLSLPHMSLGWGEGWGAKGRGLPGCK